MMAVAENGTVYVTRPEEKDVIALTEEGAEPQVIASGSTASTASPSATGASSSPPSMTSWWPTSRGRHHRRAREDRRRSARWRPAWPPHLAFAPDGALHINVGSSCDACFESTEEKAANLRLNVEDGTPHRLRAGLRNMLGFDWHPETGKCGASTTASITSATSSRRGAEQDRAGIALWLAVLLRGSRAGLGELHYAGRHAEG